MKILVVEDEPKLNKGLVIGLQHRGYVVDSAFDGEEGEKMAKVNAYDLILLDVMMPKRDGIEMCKNLRAHGTQTPVLFLTARDAVEDKILGLNFGGDDYLVKPFSFEELVARVRALLRRPHFSNGNVFCWIELQLDTRSRVARIKNKVVNLTLREYDLLEYLLRNKSAVVTREDILTNVWDQFFDSFSNVVDVHLKNLRKKLPKEYAKRIETVWGKGYRLV
jgi:DNA-binding response OmpR family regulator